MGDIGVHSSISISVTDGTDSKSLPQFAVDVDLNTGTSNNRPIIWGAPPRSGTVGEMYSFTPGSSDRDGDALTFNIHNQPDWANFDTSTGRISGLPASGDVGFHSSISISVSDGTDSASLPQFAVRVNTVGAADGSPSIWGTPPGSSTVGEVYSFTPGASDPDGDALTFSIANKPSWANFDTSSGNIAGTPAAADVGVYSGISISVSDGTDSASLPQFAVTVDQIGTASTTLSWTAPTRNEDGSTLSDLAGYKIYYGRSSGSYTDQIRIDNPGVTSYVVDNLTPNTYYFAATAFNSSGVESRFSTEAIKTAN